jgi:hypothetical protein
MYMSLKFGVSIFVLDMLLSLSHGFSSFEDGFSNLVLLSYLRTLENAGEFQLDAGDSLVAVWLDEGNLKNLAFVRVLRTENSHSVFRRGNVGFLTVRYAGDGTAP